MADALISELLKQAAVKNAAMVEPVGRTDSPDKPKGPGKLAILTYLAGLAGDVGTTAYGSATGKTTEANPLFKGLPPNAVAPIVGGTSLAAALVAKHFLHESHPTLLKGLLMAMGGAHGLAAVSNAHQLHGTAPPPSATTSPSVAPRPGMIQMPDGSWMDPNYIYTPPGK